MGVSTDGILCFGISYPSDYEFVWDKEPYDEIDDWWLREIQKYKDPFKLYSEEGGYINDIKPSKSRKDEYYDARREFEKTMEPLPVELVVHCSYDYPMYIVSLKNSVTNASRGSPQIIDPRELEIDVNDTLNLIEFCDKYCKPIGEYDEPVKLEPHWYLCSIWG